MSIISLAAGDPTCTVDDLKAIAKANNFEIEPCSVNEASFLLFANSFDAVCDTINRLPEYVDPRLVPCDVEGGEREYYKPDETENPLNAWAHKTSFRSIRPKATKGPLAGRTLAIKDNISVANIPLGLGANASLFRGGKHPISTVDATVVQRILAAGGVVKGMASCENFSAFALSFTSDSGVVHNAWLPGYATGGSSSGCAALVSIGDVEEARKIGKDRTGYPLGEGVDMAIGGDQGGSIRLPAAYSGIFGLKPTHGLIPYTGIAGLNPMIDHTGPITRTLEDSALLLGVLAGYDGIDPRMTPESPLLSQVEDYLGDLKSWISSREEAGEWTPSAAAKGLRIGILKESFEVPGLNAEITAIVKKAAKRFQTLGADVKEISIPLHQHGAAIWTIASRYMMPHFVANKPPDLLSHTMPGLDPLPTDQHFFNTLSNRNPAVVNVLMNAAHMDYRYGPALARKAHMHVWQLREAYDKALEEVDVLLTPINPTVAPKFPEGTIKTPENPKGESKRVMDLFEKAIGNTSNTCPFNVTGHPAMSMPIGWGKVAKGEGRLPVGMQLVAKRWCEADIFKAAKAWEVGGRWMDL